MLSSMNRHLLAPTLLLLTIPLAAQTPTATAPQTPAVRPRPARSTPPPAGFAQSIVLWPEGAPGAKGTAEGDIPKLFTYPTTGSGPHAAVIVMPGGGFTSLKMEQEGADEARWLAAHGVAAFVLELDQPPAMGELTVFPHTARQLAAIAWLDGPTAAVGHNRRACSALAK
jgi:acetyl esterase/lipase